MDLGAEGLVRLKGDEVHALVAQGKVYITFLDAGKKISADQLPESWKDRKDRFEFNIQLANGETRIYAPNNTALRKLIEVFGSGDTDKWVGKAAELTASYQIVQGKQAYVIYVLGPGQPSAVVPMQPAAKAAPTPVAQSTAQASAAPRQLIKVTNWTKGATKIVGSDGIEYEIDLNKELELPMVDAQLLINKGFATMLTRVPGGLEQFI